VRRGLCHKEQFTTASANKLAGIKSIAMTRAEEAGTRGLGKGKTQR
jgi:hypothetical protein